MSDDDAPMLPPVTFRVRATQDRQRLDAWVMALQSRSIPAVVRGGALGAELHVLPMHLEAAREELAAIDAEEVEARREAEVVPPPDERFHSRWAPLGAVVLALALVGFFMITGPSASRAVWFVEGASDAARVLEGEWWRTVTALTLHADSNHVLSNVALGSVVVGAVMRRTGVGYGAALVVVAGALGNFVNAWGYGVDHRSIGFSTGVFGAIGILAGLTYVHLVRGGERRRRPAWTAIAGAAALLAMLGASERSDMLAHLFGTMTGLAVGLAVGFSRWRPAAWPGQTVLGLGAAAIIVGSWALALAPV
ncbi:MAG: rhomboid family intramembrane serine protease [Myxococcota bacterium]|nr:rhomboid family intramembrane serine protease [Myxococcota bacterium]